MVKIGLRDESHEQLLIIRHSHYVRLFELLLTMSLHKLHRLVRFDWHELVFERVPPTAACIANDGMHILLQRLELVYYAPYVEGLHFARLKVSLHEVLKELCTLVQSLEARLMSPHTLTQVPETERKDIEVF